MIKVAFSAEGEISLQFPKNGNKKCIKRYGEIMAREGGVEPLAAVLLGIAATNGQKTFDRAARLFNVA